MIDFSPELERVISKVIYSSGVVISVATAIRSILGSGIRPRYRTNTDKPPIIEISENDLGWYLRLLTGLDKRLS